MITATPGWPQLQEMVAALPFEEEADTEPEADPVFERWLEESALGPGQRRPPALRVYGDFADRCAGCAAECCTTLVFPHGRPQTRRNVDYLQFALGFPGVELGISDGEWQLVVKTRCRHLTAERRCGVYAKPARPMLCRYYDASSCNYTVQFGTPRPAGFLRLRLEQFDWLVAALRFQEDGAVQALPAAEELRLFVEERWSVAVASAAAAADAARASTAAVEPPGA